MKNSSTNNATAVVEFIIINKIQSMKNLAKINPFKTVLSAQKTVPQYFVLEYFVTHYFVTQYFETQMKSFVKALKNYSTSKTTQGLLISWFGFMAYQSL